MASPQRRQQLWWILFFDVMISAQRKKAKSHGVLAIKAVAHKLCRACYYIMKNRVAFDVTKAFA